VSSLLQAGMLRRWLSSSPQLEIREPNGDGTLKVIQQFPFNQLANRMLWGLWRRMPKYLRPGSPVMAVRTTGVLTPRELADLYRESDVFAFPSVNEGLAQVLLEAMASGLVVVASDLSGADDCVTEGRDGFIEVARGSRVA
jgi:glycosyltransferase involved in cell wall biosynthesis